MMKRLEPKIGIWWIYKNTVLKFSISIRQCEAVDGWLDTSVGHFDYWEKIQSSNVELVNDDYTDHPRGRVLYNETDDMFVIYGSEAFRLIMPRSEGLVRKAFHLPGDRTRFIHDSHYDEAIPLLDSFDDWQYIEILYI